MNARRSQRVTIVARLVVAAMVLGGCGVGDGREGERGKVAEPLVVDSSGGFPIVVEPDRELCDRLPMREVRAILEVEPPVESTPTTCRFGFGTVHEFSIVVRAAKRPPDEEEAALRRIVTDLAERNDASSVDVVANGLAGIGFSDTRGGVDTSVVWVFALGFTLVVATPQADLDRTTDLAAVVLEELT